MGQQAGYPHSKAARKAVNVTVRTLLQGSLTAQTRQSYKRAWSHFHNFMRPLGENLVLPIPEPILAKFIGFLFEQEYASGTILSFMSALSFVHKILSLPDPTDSFLVKKLLLGCKKMRGQKDARLPITLSILNSLLGSVDFLFSDQFSKLRFKAMCSLAFHALLRIGEMTASDNNLSINCIKMDSGFLTLQFLKYKHSAGSVSTHRIKAYPGFPHCPVKSMAAYLKFRGSRQGPLFLSSSGTAIVRKSFIFELQQALKRAGISDARYTSHSFRIGGASFLASQGASEIQIRQAGRWASNAFMAYIRMSH